MEHLTDENVNISQLFVRPITVGHPLLRLKYGR